MHKLASINFIDKKTKKRSLRIAAILLAITLISGPLFPIALYAEESATSTPDTTVETVPDSQNNDETTATDQTDSGVDTNPETNSQQENTNSDTSTGTEDL